MPRILIIEDDDAMRDAIRIALERAGHQVAEADEGRAGLAHYTETVFDLVITDIIMPGMEGLETVQALKKFSPKGRIIAISGGGKGDADNYLRLAQHLGAQRILRKPFAMEELLAAVTAELAAES